MTKTFSPADIQGIVPPLVTPFTEDGVLDEKSLRSTIRFMLNQGVHGLVAGGSSGEGYSLTTGELARITEIAAEEIDGTVPLVAGVIANSTRDAIAKVRAVQKLGISALQVTPSHYIYKTDEESMLRHFREIAAETDIPILIYNVIPWNYLSPALLLRAMREIPGVAGVKQSAGDLKSLADLMIGAQPGDRIFAAVDSLLYPCMVLGAHGVISILTTAVPGALIQLWDAVKRGDHIFAKDMHERLLRLWNAIYADNRVATTKFTLALQGAPTGHTLRPVAAVTAAQQAAIREALSQVIPPEQLKGA
ncbi:dihydrodipicolinate synthase family protein [Bordetella genomosp. 8]|uniref:Dihydrodipicolinate synthase family protein n=1 Tax=Bordetella genomosp. 8 TaxID=1416806 RepID=A0A1W6YHD4_9BORD|nr:dihydrodipicolinate synthase family protein [Bordetella genomosp. 8]ARP80462.1 dihydrodipicolinate synthase family protein [Bordetella genomosp. 8]